MEQTWTLGYWSDFERQPCVEKWLDQRTPQQLKTIAKELKLLDRCGNRLRLPHSRSLGEGLFELREKMHGYRIYYGFLPKHHIVMLHAGDKESQENDIKVARERLAKIQKNTNRKDLKNETEKI